jgi:hypothetical protein
MKYASDERMMAAPKLPTDRPATKKEVWARYHFIYHDIKSPDDLASYCRDAWVWYFVEAVNFHQWRKQPDWVEGDPVIDEAVKWEPFQVGEWHAEVERLYQIAQSVKRVMQEAA